MEKYEEIEFMSIENQKKAVHYTLFYLRSEIKDLENSIQLGNHPAMEPAKKLLKQRLEELKKDLETFEELNNNII